MTCRIVELPEGLPDKFDLADASKFGLTRASIASLLASAAPVTYSNEVAPSRAGATQPQPAVTASGLADTEAALRFLIEREILNLGNRSDWIRVGMALKATHGDAAFELWDQLSSEAPGYDGKTEKEWATFKDVTGDRKPLTIATFAMLAKDAGWSPGGRQNSPSVGSDNSSGGSAAQEAKAKPFDKRVDPAAAVITLAEEAGDEFWLDQNGKPHVSFTVSLPDGATIVRHAPIASAAYKGVLARRYHYAMVTKVLAKDQAATAVALLEYRAEEEGVRHVSSLRVGELEERIYVDLGDLLGQAVDVAASGWAILRNPPVRFVRGSRGELPVPVVGCSFELFTKHFNLSASDVVRVVAFMIGTFNSVGSYPILFIEGEQGTGKSILCDMILALIDPPKGMKSARFSFTPDEKDFHVSAQGVRVICFDNISNFSAAAADILCRMATGAASASRKLYTDDEETRFAVVRPMIANCIGLPSSRADLLSRALRVKTRPVKSRRTEAALMREFNDDRPMMLGFLMDCVSTALRNREAVEQAVEAGDILLPRMGDFGQFVEAAASQLGLAPGEFSKLIEHEQAAMQVESALTHPIGAALMKYFTKPKATPIIKPVRELLPLLQSYSTGQEWWPASNKFGNELTRISVGLRNLGIEWKSEASNSRANVLIYYIWATPEFEPREASSDPF